MKENTHRMTSLPISAILARGTWRSREQTPKAAVGTRWARFPRRAWRTRWTLEYDVIRDG